MKNSEEMEKLLKQRGGLKSNSTEYMRLSKAISRLRNPELEKKIRRKQSKKIKDAIRGFSVKDKIFTLYIFKNRNDEEPFQILENLTHRQLVSMIQNLERAEKSIRDKIVISNHVRAHVFGFSNIIYNRYKISFKEITDGQNNKF